MRRTVLLCLVAFASQAYGNVIDDILARRQLELADAYWFAGERYIELNKVEIGRAMQARARQLVNGYRPPNEREPWDGVPSLTPAPVEVAVPEVSHEELARRAAEGARIVRIQFNRMLRNFLMEDPSALSTSLADEVDVAGIGRLQSSDVVRRLSSLFNEREIDALGLEDLVESGSVVVEKVEGTPDDYVLSVRLSPSAPDYLKERPWWASSLSLYFVRSGNDWRLRAVSRD